jgi:hypothetical protein
VTAMVVAGGLLLGLSLLVLLAWSASVVTRGSAESAVRVPAVLRRAPTRFLLGLAAGLAGAGLLILSAASFAEHL